MTGLNVSLFVTGVTVVSGQAVATVTNTPTTYWMPLMAPVMTALSAIVAGAVSWGMMRSAQRSAEIRLERIERMMFDIMQRTAHIEGVMSTIQKELK